VRKGNVCPSVWWRAALLLVLVALAPLASGAAGPAPFEDVNNNGAWDAGVDRDISAALQPTEWWVSYATPHSIVIPAGVTFLKSVERFTGFHLQAGRNITVNSSITSAVYGGMVDLRAGGTIAIAPGIALNGRDYVSLRAGGDVTVGAKASLISRGVSANLGTVHILSENGDISVGAQVKVTTLRDVFVTALGGTLTVGPELQLTAPQGALLADADGIAINGARLRAAGVQLTSAGPVAFRNNRVTLSKFGPLLIQAPGFTVDITGTPMPRTGSVKIEAALVLD
jgi:hypothetical protein